jgi:hypothetical protein
MPYSARFSTAAAVSAAALLSVLCSAAVVASVSAAAAPAAAKPQDAAPPHVVFILIDDFGYYDIGYHVRARLALPSRHAAPSRSGYSAPVLQGNPEAVTPNMDALARDGIRLE